MSEVASKIFLKAHWMILLTAFSFSTYAAIPSQKDLDKGKDLYLANGCVACHGVDGTPTLPQARSFKKDDPKIYKNGHSVEGIVKTINEGIAGTMMAKFPAIKNLADQKALASYVISLKK